MKKWFTLKCVLLLSCMWFLGGQANGQIAAWQFGNPASTGSEVTYFATTNDANLNTAVLSRGSGIAGTALARAFSSTSWTINGTKANAITNSQYFTCAISAKTGYKVSLSTLDATLRRSAAGPNAYSWQYSLDATNFTDIGTDVSFTSTADGVSQAQLNLGSFTALQNVNSGTTITIRLYAWGATAAGSTFAIGRYAASNTTNSLAIGGTVTAIPPTPTTTSISPNFASVGGASFTMTVNGSNFIDGSTVTWNGTTRTTTFVSAAQLTALIPQTDLSTAGSATVGVTTTGAVSASNTQTFTINPAVGANLSLTSPLGSFGNACINTTTGPNSFTINGSGLDGTNISIAALSGFTYSETSTGPFTSTLNFGYTGNSIPSKTIFVQFAPTAVQAYDGNIQINGGGVSNYSVPAAGSGVNTPPTVATATTAISLTATTATIGGSITSGCSAITAYGIEYSANTGFATGTGIQKASNNLSSGNFSATITGLAPNTRYYYHAYATSGGTTTYGAEVAFNETPLPVLMSAQPGLSYTQDFADIATWSNFFITGNGANHFGGLSAATFGTIPDGKTITLASNSFQGSTFGSSGGLQRGTDQVPATQSIVLLATGTTDNTTSTAIDFYMDFTGLNAGTLSFDWASVNNAAGNRNASLIVYSSTNGINFDTVSLKNASVLNFTNNSPTNDTKANIPLPRSFDNSPTARLRFYVYNGVGGSTGSRPKLSIDNLNVTAVATTPCLSPTAPATNLAFGTITDVSIAGSFTGAGTSTDGYIVVASTNSSLTKNPDDGQIYNLGDNLGDGTVVAKGSTTSFTATGLSASTLYYFFVFPMNSICTGGPLYYSTTFLTGQATTNAGLPPCAAPASQPTVYSAGAVGTNTISGSFTATTANEYLVLISTFSTFTGTINNGQLYSNGDVVGNAKVVQRSNATSFTASGLAANTLYYLYIFSSNTQACVNGPAYNITSPLTASAQTNPLPTCVAPSTQPTQLTFNSSNTAISGAFAPVIGADDYLVVMNTSVINPTPANNTDYNVGDNLGGGTVVANGSSTSFMTTGLTAGTQYYFYIFSANKNCDGGTKYLSINPLTNSTTTTNVLANNYYFGNIHSHSDYSDGNKDHQGYTPADDYVYAKTAQCMDFLGISEHNHYSGGDPGNTIGNYHLGSIQANTFTTNNPGFLAMYGMEWGVISGGGHVVVYGDGLDSLFGWESGSDGWGPTNNYDVYVPKSVYTDTSVGLFKVVNDHVSTNAFATLAHPNQTDYNNLAGDTTHYNSAADSAIVGSAVESGPATSVNTSYSNPGSSLFYLPYFQTLLAKGYHLGPTIDHDNHNTTFGHTTYSRTAVVAPALTKTEITKGYRNMHFYATQDCDSKVDFTINTKIMGSVFTDRYAPIISVNITDATTSTVSAIIKIMYGVPGSKILAVKIDSVIGNKLTFSDNNLANLATGYYYADITNGTARIITSPIWYTRNDNASPVVLPITLGSFIAQKANTNVKLNWTTEQEINSGYFAIERSADGINWTVIGNQAAAGSSAKPIDYTFYDNAPLNGINYYRLKAMDIDGKFTYSTTRSVLFTSRFQLSVSPNPAHDFIDLYVSNTTKETYHILLTDTNGKLLRKIDSQEQHLQINTSTFAKGIYFIKYVDNNLVTTKKIIIE